MQRSGNVGTWLRNLGPLGVIGPGFLKSGSYIKYKSSRIAGFKALGQMVSKLWSLSGYSKY